MGQQHGFCLAVALLSAVLLPQALGISEPGDHAASLSAFLGAMQNPELLGTAAAYQQLMSHRHSLSQGHLERSLAFMGEGRAQECLLACTETSSS